MQFNGKSNFIKLGDKESLHTANVRLMGPVPRWWERVKRWFRRRRLFPVDFSGAGYSLGATVNTFEASVRNDSDKNGNILECREVRLTWDDIKELSCCKCGRQIAIGEWSHILIRWGDGKTDIERRCAECLSI